MNSIVNFATEVTTAAQNIAPTVATSSMGAEKIGAGLAMIGVIGAGLGQGIAGAKAVEAVGRNPEAQKEIFKTLLFSSAIAETSAIYALVVAILLIFI
ncbi:F0F1 ATP synthase subunit C [Mesomycoplasma conjunctivae]|uniref:F0F1 ATP synthase subunit C n=1 Tax=Mesomycoplasma conjunctivae TaxID=45361 RepID=UPI0005A20F1A